MSLELVRTIRRTGYKPKCVHILIGEVKREMANSEVTPMIVIKNTDDLQNIDFRPLIGVDVSAFECGTVDGNRLISVLEAVEMGKPRNISLALKNGICGFDKKHELVLLKLWMAYQ
jgi:hypothetical protein